MFGVEIEGERRIYFFVHKHPQKLKEVVNENCFRTFSTDASSFVHFFNQGKYVELTPELYARIVNQVAKL